MTHAVFTFVSCAGVPEPPSLSLARESWLIWRTIRFNLDRPNRGSRLFIGRKAIIILTRSILYSDSPIGQQILKQRVVW